MPVADRRVRVLYSRNLQGFIHATHDCLGNYRVTDHHLLPDIFWVDWPRYFLAHPNIQAVYVEDADDDSYSASSANSDPADVVTVGTMESTSSADDNDPDARLAHRSRELSRIREDQGDEPVPRSLALVFRRSEITHSAAIAIREDQHRFFSSHQLNLPDPADFRDVIHGR